ncbi:DoxX family protein [Nocardia anaemiae]|uniref:DoxX family protein n=1 Tax=Nocardia anaemiae TaxID=263910 RepID=UPI0007C788CB|nr:DoxX family protein [Nocardia anaemiae]
MTAIAPVAPITTTAVAQRPGKKMNVALWTVQILLALFFIIVSAAPKLLGAHAAVESFDTIGWGQWFRYFTGLVELAGGIGLLVPRLTGPAAVGLTITMVCAALTQVFLLGAAALAPFPLVLGVVFVWIAWQRRDSIIAVRELLAR